MYNYATIYSNEIINIDLVLFCRKQLRRIFVYVTPKSLGRSEKNEEVRGRNVAIKIALEEK